MITRPTVLIFGAGVSASFGFPLGIGLRKKILGILSHSTNPVNQAGYSAADISRFRNAFYLSGQESVDAFLEHRTDCIEVGKAAIAAALIPFEKIDSLFNNPPNLYSYLFRHLNAPLEKFADNQLSIVTYNYDRSFEQYIFTALKSSFDLSNQDAAKLANAIPVVHLHGHLGLLPWQGKGGQEYGTNEESIHLGNASSTIKIIHEAVDTDPEFQKARELIEEAKTVVFLGFGYAATNVDRLKIDFKKLEQQGTDLYGSCLGFTKAEIQGINGKLFQRQLHWENPAWDALRFMRETITLS